MAGSGGGGRGGGKWRSPASLEVVSWCWQPRLLHNRPLRNLSIRLCTHELVVFFSPKVWELAGRM